MLKKTFTYLAMITVLIFSGIIIEEVMRLIITVPSSSSFQIDLNGMWKISFSDTADFKLPIINDDEWNTIHVPSLQPSEFHLLAKMKGWYWLRKSFEIKQSIPPIGLSLFLGKIKDKYQVFLNGALLAEGDGSFLPVINIPTDSLCSINQPSYTTECPHGLNTISLRVFSSIQQTPGFQPLNTKGVHIEPTEIALKLAILQYLIHGNLLQTILFVTLALSCLLMFVFYNISKKQSNHYLYFALYMLMNLPIIITRIPMINDFLYSSWHSFFLFLGLTTTPTLFLLFTMELFDSPRFAKKASLGFLIISLMSVNLWLMQADFNLVDTIRSNQIIEYFLYQISLFIYISTSLLALANRFILQKGQSDIHPVIYKYFFALLIPFISGKFAESLSISFSQIDQPAWNLMTVQFYNALFLLIITPIISGVVIYTYLNSQSTKIIHANYRIRVLEILEKTAKDIPKENILISIVEVFCHVVQAKRGSISLLEEGNYRVKATYGINDMSIYNQIIGKQSEQMKAMLASSDHINITDITTHPLRLVHTTGDRYKSNSAMFFKLHNAISNFGVVIINEPIDRACFSHEDFEFIQSLLPHLSKYLENKQIIESLDNQFEGIITAFAETINRKSSYTKFHSLGVITTLEALTEKMGLPFTRDLRTAALLHDLGKVFIPDYILDKPGRLNKREMDEIKSHPMHTGKILSSIPGFETIAQWASMHHESFDGTGYPFAMIGDNIPIEAQLINAADYIDALATNRPYRDRLSFDAIIRLVEENASKFRHSIRDAMIVLLKDKSFRAHYDLKASDFKPKESLEELKVKFIVDRIKSMYESLESISNVMPKNSDKQTLEFEVRHLLVANVERFNQLYDQVMKDIIALHEPAEPPCVHMKVV